MRRRLGTHRGRARERVSAASVLAVVALSAGLMLAFLGSTAAVAAPVDQCNGSAAATTTCVVTITNNFTYNPATPSTLGMTTRSGPTALARSGPTRDVFTLAPDMARPSGHRVGVVPR